MFVPCGPRTPVRHRKFRIVTDWVPRSEVGVALELERSKLLLASAEQNRDRVATAVTQTRDRPTAPRESESRVTTDRSLRAPSHRRWRRPGRLWHHTSGGEPLLRSALRRGATSRFSLPRGQAHLSRVLPTRSSSVVRRRNYGSIQLRLGRRGAARSWSSGTPL